MTQAEVDYRRIEKAIRHVEAHAMEQPSLAELARHVHLSEFHFNRLFKRWAGATPKQFLQCLTKEHAKRLLRSGASVLAASHEVGLSGPGRLHDLFVTCEAMTPGEYKDGGRSLAIRYGFYQSPFGSCLMAMTGKGLCCLRFQEESSQALLLKEIKMEWPKAEWVEEADLMEKWGDRIFGGKPRGENLHLHVKGSPFQIQVWQALLRIPDGSVVSYGQLARSVGKPQGARAVGNAVGQNPVAVLIPCHRVLRESGALGGYRWGLDRKQMILGRELAGSMQ